MSGRVYPEEGFTVWGQNILVFEKGFQVLKVNEWLERNKKFSAYASKTINPKFYYTFKMGNIKND